jgi:hypothetical protein
LVLWWTIGRWGRANVEGWPAGTLGTMVRPTASEVRGLAPAQFDWALYGYPTGVPDPLEARIAYAAASLRLLIGRTLESIIDVDEEAIADHAITLLTMQETMGGATAALEIMGAPWLKAFTAGSYSEQRFSPSELQGTNGKVVDVISKLNPWPALARDLWLLATEERREEWVELYGGRVRPEGGIFEQDWDGGPMGVLWPYGARGWPS